MNMGMRRRIRRIPVAICAALAISAPAIAQSVPPVAAKPAPRLAPGDHTFKLDHGGRNREYIVHMPPATDSIKALPILLAFHGGGGEAQQYKQSAGLDVVADREKFVVVYPYGMGALPRRLLTWNAGECCGPAMNRNVDDVGFAVAVLDDVMRRTGIDSRRVYATGHSNGAMMSYRLAAERADRIVAIAAVSGAYNMGKFAPSRAVAVLDIHSVGDPRALYHGGMGPAFPGTTVQSSHRPVMEGINRWVRNNKCADSTVVESRGGQAGTINAGQTASLIVWRKCAPGGDVAHWKLTGVGHGWPGDVQAANRERIIGKPTTLISAAEEVWKFVSRVKR
jgi:polyhydroxybutyrate depolymerase